MSDEKTLILFKPDCVRKNLSGVILQRLLAEGFHLRGMKMMQLDDAILREHYGHIIDLVIDGEPLFPKLSAFMQTSPVVALVLSGPGVVTRVRTILGPTNSMKADKGTIRGDFGTNSMLNICHASDSPESAEAEVKRFFKPEELFDNVCGGLLQAGSKLAENDGITDGNGKVLLFAHIFCLELLHLLHS